MSRDPLLILWLVTLLLFGTAVVFAVAVFTLHFRTSRRAERFALLERAWEPQLLEALVPDGGEATPIVIPPAHRRHFLNYLVRFARRLRGAERDALQALAAPYLPLILPQLRHRRPEVRARAVQTLATLGLPEYGATVVAALEDPAEVVAMTAARGLARREFPQYADAVLSHLERFDCWHAEYLAALLAGIGTAAAPALRAALAHEALPPRVRAVSAMALNTLCDLGAGPVAAAALAHAEDVDLVQALLRLLQNVGGGEHVPLVRALTQHPVDHVRSQAVMALGRLGAPEDVGLLLAALDDASPWVSLRAGQALAAARQSERLRQYADEAGQRGIVAREVLSEVRA